ncbi:dolichol-phosphate mannosyltransferase subunit 3 [Babesia ovata]|uniref:Dolichol-phosphate mannosyltransferase subunit 3 n=1 Tax=Babesia ovata TaxID=189622 RepID=A0A2H6KER6_9APIC|nr:dolichol-phosphate mannosyltransferase subunit 3 [Babesia ovata]GBE61492.1 dolichol-phosphate mannosyltransferase subunit 3 [Babesia ovata]
MAVSRGKIVAVLLVLYAAVWAHVFRQPRTLPVLRFLLAPIVAVAALGVYAAYSVILGVITFNRSHTATAELKEDLKMAVVGLRRLGFDFEKFGIPRA